MAGAVTPIALVTLQAMVAVCNPPPDVTWQRVAAHVRHESGFIPTAIHDNTANRSFYPDTISDAVAMATQLRAAGHSFDSGLGQIWSGNWDWMHLTPARVMDPQSNVCAATIILAQAYDIEARVSNRYACGKPDCNTGYAARIAQMQAELARGQWPAVAAAPTPATPAVPERSSLANQIVSFGRSK